MSVMRVNELKGWVAEVRVNNIETASEPVRRSDMIFKLALIMYLISPLIILRCVGLRGVYSA